MERGLRRPRRPGASRRRGNSGTQEVGDFVPEKANKDLVLRYLKELNEGNLEAAVACFADDLVGYEPSRDLHGRDGLMHSLAGFRNAFPDIRVTVEDLVAEEDRVVARWAFRGTQRGEVLGVAPTGRRVTGMIFYRISEGRISEYWGSWDRLGLLQQLGTRPQL